LDALDGEGQFGHHIIDEGYGGLLVAARVGAQHPQPGAVINRGELVELLALPPLLAQRFDELDIDLQLMARPLLLLPFPRGLCRR
jgi:hypothetical protein